MSKKKQGALSAAMINRAMGRNEAAILSDLMKVESSLSPENLSCDGELSAARQRATYKRLCDEWHALVRELGRYPKMGELMDPRVASRMDADYLRTVCTQPGESA